MRAHQFPSAARLTGCLPPFLLASPPRARPCSYPLRLLFFWTMQGLWAWACMLPVTAAHALRCAAWRCSDTSLASASALH